MAKRVSLSLVLLAWATVSTANPVDQVSSSRLSFIVNGYTLKLPYYRNRVLSGSYPSVTRAVVMIHGTLRNGSVSYENMVTAAGVAGVPDSTALLIAPQFLTEEDISAKHLTSDVLYWDQEGWKQGDLSLGTVSHPRPDSISTFAVIDSILYRIASQNPNLRLITVAGHSAGGQFVNRYAAANRIELALYSEFGVTVHYVAANPSSYLYFDGQRVVPGTMDEFDYPVVETMEACPDYDTYKYGLYQPNPYVSNVSAGQLMSQFATRQVMCLLGGADTSTTDANLDTTCAARLQGPYRLARGLIYQNYLKQVFGAGVLPSHGVEVIAGVGHDSNGIFTSLCGALALFGSTSCSFLDSGPPAPEPTGLSLSFPNPLPVAAQIRFRLPDAAARVTLRVYDIRGCIMRTLVDGAQPAGMRTVFWDGRSDHGTRLAPGMYICRLQQSSRTVTTKVAILR